MTTSALFARGAGAPTQTSMLLVGAPVTAPVLAPRARAAVCSGTRFRFEPQGAFSLRESALFGFGYRYEDSFDGCMRMCFCLDGYRSAAGVVVTQDACGVVRGQVVSPDAGACSTEAVAVQTARVLSLDVDTRGFASLAQADSLLAPLFAAAPGLRPPLFHSAYEAALWSVLSARRPWRIGRKWLVELARAAGTRFELAGRTMWCPPLPRHLCELGAAAVQSACRIEAERAARIVAVAEAACAGELDSATLARDAQRDLDRARSKLKRLPGIGPFYADLILLRATGLTDVLPAREPRFLEALAALCGRGQSSSEHVERLERNFSPFRTWAAAFVRAVSPRVLATRARAL